MQTWQRVLRQSITSPRDLPSSLVPDPEAMEKVASVYPMRINPYFLEVARRAGPALLRQVIPDPRELEDQVCLEDPLGEEDRSPVPNLVHKYPDRALFLVHGQCAAYCRFCTRKRKVGTAGMSVARESITAGIDYLRRTPSIRDVLVSGGDPLLLPDEKLARILAGLRSIPSIEIIRIGSRVPCTLPMRITGRLTGMLKRFHPLYLNTHFNHPAEITAEAATACGRLADAGIPVGCQTVLLKGVNDDPELIRQLLHRLLTIRVRPYYLFQADLTRGTDHFRTTIRQGLEIMKALIGHTSGIAVPTYAVDAPGGGGKIPLTPDYLLTCGKTLVFRNYQGDVYSYPQSAYNAY